VKKINEIIKEVNNKLTSVIFFLLCEMRMVSTLRACVEDKICTTVFARK
jgi:hypothetical protein